MKKAEERCRIQLPFRLLPIINGEESDPHTIEMEDLRNVECYIERDQVCGRKMVPCVDDQEITSFHYSTSKVMFDVTHEEEEKSAVLNITGLYGDTRFEANIVILFVEGGHHQTTTDPYVIREIAVGQGEPIVPDYKTDMYFDGAERIMVQRTEDGDTEVLDEHETPIISRKHNGNTVVYDAYQNERVIVSPNGDVAINAGGKHALYVEGEKVYILGVGGFNGVTTAGAQSIDEVLAQ